MFTWMLAVGMSLYTGGGNEDATRKAYDRFEGVWRFALVEADGVKQPAVPFETHKMIISKKGRFLIVQGNRITRGVVKLDPSTSPKHYDVTIFGFPGKNPAGSTFKGVYELEDDTCKICMPLRGEERPASLESKPGGGCLLHVFQRTKLGVPETLLAVGRQELAGTWKAVTYALDGKEASAEQLKAIQLVIDAEGKATAYNDGKIFIAATTQIDLSQAPMTMNVTFTAGDAKGRTALGIYKIEGDVLTICRAAPAQARPTEFSSNPGSGLTLMTYQRSKTSSK